MGMGSLLVTSLICFKRIVIFHPNSTSESVERWLDEAESGSICEPMHQWQTQSLAVCNLLHEVDIESNLVGGGLSLLSCGWSRCAFKMREVRDTEPLALKLSKLRKQVSPRDYEKNRRDGMIMERLTKSPYVLTSYGFCGLSQVNECGEAGSAYDLIERFRGRGNHTPLVMSPLDKLRVGIQIVTALADLHGFEDDGVASVTHNDLESDQFILVDGVYKLNDFHLAHLLQRNRTTRKTCWNPMKVRRTFRKLHAPEESYGGRVDNEKADDYVAGNMMYYILTGKWIFEGVKNDVGIEWLRKGKRPPFTDHIANSTDPANLALMKGINMLWTHDVKERPSARMVSNFLIQMLEKIEGHRPEDGIIRVSVPPLPADWNLNEEGPSWDENIKI